MTQRKLTDLYCNFQYQEDLVIVRFYPASLLSINM